MLPSSGAMQLRASETRHGDPELLGDQRHPQRPQAQPAVGRGQMRVPQPGGSGPPAQLGQASVEGRSLHRGLHREDLALDEGRDPGPAAPRAPGGS